MNKLKVVAVIAILLVLNLSMIGLLANRFKAQHQAETVAFGVTFSQKYAQELGLDWQAAYGAIIEGLGIKKVRLMSYWDRHERKNNQYDFRELDWMMDEAAKHNMSVSIAVGLRQPRWPECHQPDWVSKLGSDQVNEELLEYISEVVNRYKNHPATESWQLENEASNQLFGICPKYSERLYKKEFDTLKRLDPKHDLITNVSNQIGVPLNGPVGKRVGFSIYNHATPLILSQPIRWSYWYVPAWWHSLRAALIEGLHSARTFVHELQAEPWGPVATPLLSSDEQYELMDPRQLRENIDFTLDAGFREIYLWGAEWWYWRKVKFNDSVMWDSAKQAMRQY